MLRLLSFRWLALRAGVTARLAFAAVAGLLASSSLLAQSCAMCYDQATQAGAKASRAIDHGILLLLLPTLCFFAGVLVYAVRRANAHQ